LCNNLPQSVMNKNLYNFAYKTTSDTHSIINKIGFEKSYQNRKKNPTQNIVKHGIVRVGVKTSPS